MKCEDIRDRLMDVTAEDLTSTEPEVRKHLNACERCRQDLLRSEGVWALLAKIPEETPDWSRIRVRLAETLEDYRQTIEQNTPHRPWRDVLGRPWWRPAFTAAMIVAALVIGAVVGRQIPAGGRAPNHDLNAMRQELREVREMLTLSLMQQTLASDRIKGASWAAQIDNPRPDIVATLIDVLLHDSNVNVRLACLRALERFEERPAVRQGVVKALTAEHSPLVSIALIDFIVEANDKMAIDTLRELSIDPVRDAAVRERAAQALNRLGKGGQG
jgi:HEAT repeats